MGRIRRRRVQRHFWSVLFAVVVALVALVMVSSGSLSPAKADAAPATLEKSAFELQDPGATWRQECNGLAVRFHMGKFLYETHEPARGRKYRGGTSWVRHYRHGECHCITRNGNVLHGPHVRAIGDPQ
jgi:hypothetical protein